MHKDRPEGNFVGKWSKSVEWEVTNEHGNAPIIAIITATFVKEVQGTIGLAMTTASRILVNWDILEVNEFRKVCSERKGIRSYRCHDLCLA
ncbi:hypothetical protein MKW98_016474 [Papaver atlanticum]|uniref:Uncharacterized protein n=1 Tax=Papaver atlanticum TaxID=357466 RepID=A0AAD4T9A9_9MAGN|nr:hypothetical protein MKW98_016474 [Papaver atlanticum]